MLHELLTKTYANNTVKQWAIAVAVAAAVWVALVVVKYLVIHRLQKFAEKTANSIDDLVVDVLSGTRFFSYLALSAYSASHFVHLEDKVENIFVVAVIVLLVIQFGLWSQRAVHSGVNAWKLSKGESSGARTMSSAITFIANLAIWTFVFVVVLQQVGIEVGAVVTGLGIGGIAAALAVQNVLGDLFASLALYFDTPFDIGDFVVTQGNNGNVEKIGLRSTRIRALSGEQLIFPNAVLANNLIQNYKRMDERRILFSLGLVYGTPYEKLKKVPLMIQRIIEQAGQTRFDRCHFASYGDSALVFETVYYVLSPDYAVYMDKQQEINFAVYQRFEEEGLEFAFPTQTLHLVKDGS